MAFGRILRIATFFMVMLAAGGAWAVSSSLWETDSKKDFDAGEVDEVSVMPPGQVVLGPRTDETDLEALYVWALGEDSKGNVYAGTGSDGKIFKLPPKGDAELFTDLELQQVFALADDDDGVLYAGGFPDGKIYSIDAGGEASEYFDTGQDSVWSLCIIAGGTLIASTGDEGQIFKIEAKEKGSLLYDSPERRILSLLCDAEGNLYAGSEQHGIIYKIDKDGHPFVLYDTELEEVTSMTMDNDGNLYAVSSPGDLFLKAPPKVVPMAVKSGNDGSAAVRPADKTRPAMPGMPAIPSAKKRTSFIYKITKEGVATKFWASPEKLIFSIAFDGTNILAGSGDEGIIYLISPRGEDAIYFKADQKQVLRLFRLVSGRIIASTGNAAAVVSLEDAHSAEGTFVSQVHDATAVSRWGRVFWEAEAPRRTRISLATRSGNSETPDDTWSEWSREQEGAEGFVSESPVARFIQWRATLTTSSPEKTPTLNKVTVAYLQTNLAPEVQSVTVSADDGKKNKGVGDALRMKAAVAASKGKAASKASKDGVKAAPPAHMTKLRIKWQASDENGDDLEYELYFKGTEEKNWKTIEDELTEKSFEWDTEAVPDGEYHVRVVVSDSPSNPAGSSLSAERVSEPFIVDNTSPEVGKLRAAREPDSESYLIRGVVSDDLSPVRSAQYSIDAGDWKAVFPSDGIFDSLSEKVEFATQPLEAGEHTVVLKAIDYFGNVGAGKVTFEVR